MSAAKSPCVVVFGASGNIGWGVAQALLQDGLRVIAPTRSQSKVADVRDSLGGGDLLSVVVGDPSTLDGARALAEHIEAEHGPIARVVASMGPWWQGGPIVEQPESEYRKVMRASLDCHVFAAQAFLPLLAERAGASYTIITGAAADMAIPGTGLLTVAVSGLLGLSRMLRAEHKDDAVRVNEIMIHARVERRARDGVVESIGFGQAVQRLHASDVDGEQLAFKSLATFSL